MRTSPVLLIVVGAVSFLVAAPIGFLIFGMFWSSFPGAPGHLTTKFVIEAFTDVKSLTLLINTLIFAAGSSAMSVALAFLLAWIIHRTDTPGRRFFDILPLITFMFPSMLGDIAWTFLLSPTGGLINLALTSIFALSQAPFNIYSLGGMIWSQGLSLTALAYLLIGAAFGSMDPSLEEAARASGASTLQTMFRVTLPLLSPSLLSTGALIFMISVNSFETPTFIGLPGNVYVFMNAIFERVSIQLPPDYGGGTALAFISLLLSTAAVTFYLFTTRKLKKYAVVTGKGYKPKPIRLRKFKYLTLAFMLGYVVIALGLPLFMMLLMSFMRFFSIVGVNPLEILTLENYQFVTRDPLMLRSVFNSFLLSAAAAFLTAGAALVMSYTAIKSRMKGKRVLEILSAMPVAYPGMIFALALIWTFLFLFRFIYGTIIVLVLAYIVVFFPYAMRALTNSIIQIHSELEEAARTSGAGSLSTIRRVTLPLLRPALINTLILVFIQSYRQLGAAVLLVTPETMVLPVAILHWWNSGLLVYLSAAVMVYGAILVAVVMVARYVLRASLTF